MNPTLSDLVGRLKAAGHITAEDVLAMRAQVYAAPQVAREDVEALIALDTSAHDFAPEWGGFVADAMVDYVVHQQDPQDYVDDAKAAWLVSACAGPLTKDGGVEALVRVLEAAPRTRPQSLAGVRARQGQGGDRRGGPPRRGRRGAAASAGVRRRERGQHRGHPRGGRRALRHRRGLRRERRSGLAELLRPGGRRLR